MLRVEEALDAILATVQPLEHILVPLADSLGLILAQDIRAQENIPPFANSAMDGFALLSKDSRQRDGQPPRLRIIGEVAAGSTTEQVVEEGTAFRIMTGAPIPPGADAVIQVELTRHEGPNSTRVEILQEVPPGNNIRLAGEDIQRGQTVLEHGSKIGPWEIGVLATLGWAHVPVIRRPRVAILSTGDELIGIDEPLAPGKIRDSNGSLLTAAVKQAGAEAHHLGIVRDTRESLRTAFAEASHSSRYDLLLTSGGVSVGDFDLVKQVLQEEGSITFWRINMRPGKPVAFGHLRGVPLLGLPGNPVSSAIVFQLFGLPLIRKLQGHPRLHKPQIPVTVINGIHEHTTRRHYVRAHVEWQEGQFMAHLGSKQGSHITTSLLNTNALLIVPEGSKGISSGETAQAIMLDWPEQ